MLLFKVVEGRGAGGCDADGTTKHKWQRLHSSTITPTLGIHDHKPTVQLVSFSPELLCDQAESTPSL